MGDGPEYFGAAGTEDRLGRDGLVAAIVVLVGRPVAALAWCALCRARVPRADVPADAVVWVVVGVDGAEAAGEDTTVWFAFVDSPHAVSPVANRVTITDQRATVIRGRGELRPTLTASNPT